MYLSWHIIIILFDKSAFQNFNWVRETGQKIDWEFFIFYFFYAI